MSRFSVSRAMERVEGGAREVVVIPRAMLSDIDAFDDDRGAGSGGRAPRRLWDVISHQRWFILGFTALVMAAVAAWSFTRPPTYESTATIQMPSARVPPKSLGAPPLFATDVRVLLYDMK